MFDDPRRYRVAAAIVLAAAILVAAGAAPTARAQSAAGSSDGVVTGAGAVTLKRLPDVMRVQVQLSAEGKTVKEALAKLKERRESAKKKLASLGAVAESIAADDPQIEGADPRGQQVERLMRMRNARRAPNAAGGAAAAAAPVRVTGILRGEWALSSKTVEESLVAVTELREKVRAADLAEVKMASLEEQEAREEAAAETGEQAAAPGEPAFVFVARITDEERAKSMAEAFAKAKDNAAALARAAGAQLGPLKQLAGQSGGEDEAMQLMEYNYRRYRQPMMVTPGEREAASSAPGMVTVTVSVTASFAIK